MKICEEFYTLQGEGKYMGVPSYFVRTTGCNLRCAWENPDGTTTVCDTPYTSWKPEVGKDVTANDILTTLEQYPQCRHVVITGGEPTIQPDLPSVVQGLTREGYTVTIESNGTKYVDIPRAFMSLSPKLRTSYAQPVGSVEAKLHEKNNAWKEATTLYAKTNDYQLKFVYNGISDINEILAFLNETGLPASSVYLMPQGITVGQFQQKAQEMFELCKHYGFNYSPRMHIDVFGNKRGI